MAKFKSDTIVYSIIVEDLQTVALQELERELSESEIEKIIDSVAENINWYDAIENAIRAEIEIDGVI